MDNSSPHLRVYFLETPNYDSPLLVLSPETALQLTLQDRVRLTSCPPRAILGEFHGARWDTRLSFHPPPASLAPRQHLLPSHVLV